MAFALFRRKRGRPDADADVRDEQPKPTAVATHQGAAVPPEVLRQVKLLELRTRGLVNSLFTGEYRSTFKGQGMEFAEVREYQPGDEVRSIDWNVTARMQRPYVKRYIEERELTVMLAVDVSGSERFGTRRRSDVTTFNVAPVFSCLIDCTPPRLTIAQRAFDRELSPIFIDEDEKMRRLAHRPQSSFASRLTAGASGFLNLSQSGERPDSPTHIRAMSFKPYQGDHEAKS